MVLIIEISEDGYNLGTLALKSHKEAMKIGFETNRKRVQIGGTQ